MPLTPSERALRQRLERRANAMAPQARARLLAAYDMIRASLNPTELQAAISSGSVTRLINALFSDAVLDPAFGSLKELVDQTSLQAGATWASDLPRRVAAPVFDVLNPRILESVRRLDTRVIQTLKSEVRETVRQTVTAGIEKGVGPRVLTKAVSETIGLPPHAARWVANFRAELESGDRAALGRALSRGVMTTSSGATAERAGHAGGKGLTQSQLDRLDKMLGKEPLTKDQIDRMVSAYQRRLTAWNAETNARTIALDTHRLAQRNSWENAIAMGVVEERRLIRTWSTVMDGRERPEHAAMNGQAVRWGQPYSNGQMIPGESDYNCRCLEQVSVADDDALPTAA